MEKKFLINNETINVSNITKSKDKVSFELDGKFYEFSLTHQATNELSIERDQKNNHLRYKNGLTRIAGRQYKVEKEQLKRGGSGSDDHGSLKSPMPGKILKLSVSEGAEVVKGETLLVMEAMKMEHSLKAPCDCTVDQFLFKEGELVEGDIELIAITPKEQQS